MTDKNVNSENVLPDNQTLGDKEAEDTRRDALKKMARFSGYTAPAILASLASSEVTAQTSTSIRSSSWSLNEASAKAQPTIFPRPKH